VGQNLSTNLGLSVTPEFPQNKYPEVWGDLQRIRNAISVLQSALDTYTGALSADPSIWSKVSPADSIRSHNISRVYALATDNILAGRLVNFYNNGGSLGARNANATTGSKPAHAFALSAVNSGNWGEFIVLGVCTTFSGMVPGTRYFLATTDGNYTASAPGAAGNIVQAVGYVLTPTTFYFNPSLQWTQL